MASARYQVRENKEKDNSVSAKIAIADAEVTLFIINNEIAKQPANDKLIAEKKSVSEAIGELHAAQKQSINSMSFLKITAGTYNQYPKSKEAQKSYDEAEKDFDKTHDKCRDAVRKVSKAWQLAEKNLGISSDTHTFSIQEYEQGKKAARAELEAKHRERLAEAKKSLPSISSPKSPHEEVEKKDRDDYKSIFPRA